jgi:hypothetical protein
MAKTAGGVVGRKRLDFYCLAQRKRVIYRALCLVTCSRITTE